MSGSGETLFWLNTADARLELNVANTNSNTYRFGFTGWKQSVAEEPDPFEEFVRETRKNAGIVDPPREPASRGGQITWGVGRSYMTYGAWKEISEYVASNGGKGGKKKA